VAQILFIHSVWKESSGGTKIGIIGGGIMGKLILNTFLPYLKKQKMNPSDLHVSTRRPENLNYYE
jgi:pyrroline-5-carboxylate reductase